MFTTIHHPQDGAAPGLDGSQGRALAGIVMDKIDDVQKDILNANEYIEQMDLPLALPFFIAAWNKLNERLPKARHDQALIAHWSHQAAISMQDLPLKKKLERLEWNNQQELTIDLHMKRMQGIMADVENILIGVHEDCDDILMSVPGFQCTIAAIRQRGAA